MYMTKKKSRTLISLLIALILCLSLFAGCSNNSKTTYTINVMSEGGKYLSDIKVSVYKDDTQEELVWAAYTDEEGCTSFEAEESDDYVAVLQEVPDGYQAEEAYSIQGEKTELKLEIVLGDGSDLTDVIYRLGDVIHDFTLAVADGTEYELSEVLKEKKAVVLNFWYINCGPCKMEFPYLQEAYEQYKDDIEVIAINPVDGTNDSIATFAQDMGLTFPMAVGETEWETCMELTAYPTTVVIDRYGTIAMIHKGMVTETEVFTSIFEYFTSDDYKQTTIRSIDDIK